MLTTKKGLDCVKMTREIRDRLAEELSPFSDEEKILIINEKAKKYKEERQERISDRECKPDA